MSISNTTYQIEDLTFYPNLGNYVVNNVQVGDDDIEIENPWFFYNEKWVNCIRWSQSTKLLKVEYGTFDQERENFASEGLDEIPCDNPRTNELISECFNRFEEIYLDKVWEMLDNVLLRDLDSNKEELDQFSLYECKKQFLTSTDWMLVADSPLTEQERNQWISWRQRIRDWQSTGNNYDDINLKVPTPPTTEGHGSSILEMIIGFESFKLNKRRYEGIKQLNLMRNDITAEEYLANGPVYLDIVYENLFSDDQFYRKYSL